LGRFGIQNKITDCQLEPEKERENKKSTINWNLHNNDLDNMTQYGSFVDESGSINELQLINVFLF